MISADKDWLMAFEEIRSQAVLEWEVQKYGKEPIVRVGAATCGLAAGAEAVLGAFERELRQRNIEAVVTRVGCIGLCYAEPIVDIVMPGQPHISYRNVTADIVPMLVQGHIVDGNPCLDFVLGIMRGNGEPVGVPALFDLPMLKPQVRIALRNCGTIDPENMQHYVANFGYSGLARALGMEPQRVIDEVKRSGLRGRGGGGIPTGEKWQACRNSPGESKYVICNADESDPGAFVNRTLLESDPHSVLEGMLIGAYAIGASEGYVFCRADHRLAVKRLQIAVQQMEERGLLGADVLGSGFSFNLIVREGTGALVCGEDTAVIAAIEGKRPTARSCPPFPAVHGLWGRPTVVNNLETWANVSAILQRGATSYSARGTEASRGTKTFALAGKVKRSGPIEVPLGTTLSEIIYDIGGGMGNAKGFKGVHVGGPLGGCLPADFLNMPLEYETLARVGAGLRSGSIVVLDEENCAVDLARYLLTFSQSQSCGRCVPCRVGTKHMVRLLERIAGGQGEPGDIEQLQRLAQTVRDGSLCELGQNIPNPVFTTLLYFREDYEAHVNEKRCPAGACKMGVFAQPVPLRNPDKEI
jgi:NADH-quinone oxidoreductase subunit F